MLNEEFKDFGFNKIRDRCRNITRKRKARNVCNSLTLTLRTTTARLNLRIICLRNFSVEVLNLSHNTFELKSQELYLKLFYVNFLDQFFTNALDWQYCHFCQLCVPTHLPFTSLFTACVVNVNLDVNFSWLLMAQLKQSWQYWHSCIVESFWKNSHRWVTSIPWNERDKK